MILSPIQKKDLHKPLDDLFAPAPLLIRKRHSLGTIVLAYGGGLAIGAILLAMLAGIH